MLRKFSHPNLGATEKPFLEYSNERQIPGLCPATESAEAKGRLRNLHFKQVFQVVPWNKKKISSKFEKSADGEKIRHAVFLFNYDIIQIPSNSPFESIQLRDFSIVTGCITTTIQVQIPILPTKIPIPNSIVSALPSP